MTSEPEKESGAPWYVTVVCYLYFALMLLATAGVILAGISMLLSQFKIGGYKLNKRNTERFITKTLGILTSVGRSDMSISRGAGNMNF